jgi:serine/threonine protein kinase
MELSDGTFLPACLFVKSPLPNPAALDPVAVSDSDTAGPVPPIAPSDPQSSTLHPQSPPVGPPQVPDYELLRRIGSGSYGDVWLARNVLGQCRAVKIIYRNRFVDPRPFEREFEGIQRFEPISRSHPSQLAILHVGKNDAAGCFYYVMELADPANDECGMSNVELPPTAASGKPNSPFVIRHSDLY